MKRENDCFKAKHLGVQCYVDHYVDAVQIDCGSILQTYTGNALNLALCGLYKM